MSIFVLFVSSLTLSVHYTHYDKMNFELPVLHISIGIQNHITILWTLPSGEQQASN